MTVKLSDWVFRSIEAKEVLTLHRDYFRLRKAIERRIYEIARKHCGKQNRWKISLESLKRKCGSKSPMKGFRHSVKELVKGDHLPDYAIKYIPEDDMVIFINRMMISNSNDYDFPILDSETYHDAKTVAPSYDIYYLEQEWRNWWVESGKPEMRSPDKAFIGFCRSRYQRKPNP